MYRHPQYSIRNRVGCKATLVQVIVYQNISMKKLICFIACFSTVSAVAQEEKWFFSFSVGAGLGGPSASIKNKMRDQGFNETSSFDFLGFSSTTDYPIKHSDLSFHLRFGIRLNKLRSLYFILGQTDKGEVTGFKNQGYSSFLGIFGGSDGPRPTVTYTVYQVTGGYMYHTSSQIKLGLGPSLFIVPYSDNTESKTSVMPGVSLTARLPLGKGKKLFGLEVFCDANLAPPVTMNVTGKTAEGFEMKKANLIQLNAGLAFTVRKIK